MEREACASTENGNYSQEDEKNTQFIVIACGENERRARAQRTRIILEGMIRIPRLSCSISDRTRGACKHNKQEFFLRGREEHPICCDCLQREQEVHASTKDGNSSQEDKKKTPFVVLVYGENERRAQA